MIITKYNPKYFDEINRIYYCGRKEELRGLCNDEEILPLDNDMKKLKLFNEGKKLIFIYKGKISGFLVVNDSLISMLYVAKENQGQGIGRKLLNASYEFFDNEIFINVSENNIKAYKLYESEGFFEVEKFEVIFKDSRAFALRMKKRKILME